jgi:hypothetical protein
LNVFPSGLHDFIVRQEEINDKLADEQLIQARELQEQFEVPFKNIRRDLGEQLKGEQYPVKSLKAFWDLMFQEGGAFWRIGGELMKGAFPGIPDEAVVREFVQACPPFRALLLAYSRREYEFCIAEQPATKRSKLASRIDTYMASYLPYADRFITNDDLALRMRLS